MKTILNSIILSGIITCFSACYISPVSLPQPEINNVKLNISTPKSVLSDSLYITVSLENTSDMDFYVYKDKDVTAFSFHGGYVWALEVLFQDSILMVPSTLRLDRSKIPTKDDYLFLKRGEKYTFTFYADIKELVPKSVSDANVKDLRILNKCYGEYTMKLLYKDAPYSSIRSVLTPILTHAESNTIKIVYIE